MIDQMEFSPSVEKLIWMGSYCPVVLYRASSVLAAVTLLMPATMPRMFSVMGPSTMVLKSSTMMFKFAMIMFSKFVMLMEAVPRVAIIVVTIIIRVTVVPTISAVSTA